MRGGGEEVEEAVKEEEEEEAHHLREGLAARLAQLVGENEVELALRRQPEREVALEISNDCPAAVG